MDGGRLGMNWEEYQNSDFYKESHPDWNKRKSHEDLVEDEMRRYLGCLDGYYEKIREQKKKQEEENDGEVDECLYNGTLLEDKDNEERIVRYVVTRIFNGRVRGIIGVGNYKQALLKRYEYNVACVDSEWDWAGIERITAADEDELSDILDSYRECEYDDYDYDY